MLNFNELEFKRAMQEVIQESVLERFKELSVKIDLLSDKPQNPGENLIDRRQLSNILGVTVQTIIKWDKKGITKPIRISSRVYYDLQKVLEQGPF